MANTIWTCLGAGGYTLYGLIRDPADGDIWYPTGQVFEAHGTGARDNDDYDLTVTDCSAGLFIMTMDANIPEGDYVWQFMNQAGANPADSDVCLASGNIHWDGAAEVTMSEVYDAVIDNGRRQGPWR